MVRQLCGLFRVVKSFRRRRWLQWQVTSYLLYMLLPFLGSELHSYSVCARTLWLPSAACMASTRAIPCLRRAVACRVNPQSSSVG